MDKKMYNKPEMKIVLLRHRAFLLSSPPAESDPSGPGGQGSEVPGGTTGSKARRFDWDGE